MVIIILTTIVETAVLVWCVKRFVIPKNKMGKHNWETLNFLRIKWVVTMANKLNAKVNNLYCKSSTCIDSAYI